MPINMKYEGIDGPLTGKYKGWIALESAQLGFHPGSKPGNGGEIVIGKNQDSASGQLLKEAVWGTGKKVTIDFLKKDDVVYLSIEFEKTTITSFSTGGPGGSPFETISMSFSKATYSAKQITLSIEPEHLDYKFSWDSFIYQETL
jgi:type VI protein secretion system component Hcp